MFVAGQPRLSFLSLILDNYCSGLPKSINRCRQLLKISMSQNEIRDIPLPDGSPENRENINRCKQLLKTSINEIWEIPLPDGSPENRENAVKSDDLSVNSINSGMNEHNIRRAWSAENLFDSSTSLLGGEPYFYFNWNFPLFFPPPQQGGFYWNNGFSFPASAQYCPNPFANVSGGFGSPMQDNYVFHGVGPPPHRTSSRLFASHSDFSVQRRYRHVKRNNSVEDLPRETVNPKVLKVLSKRYWEEVKKQKKSSKSKPGVEFTVMSYNVLAQDLITEHSYLYKNHNPRSLQWQKRWKNLFDEISKLMPDIMCLQEVQGSHVSPFYSKLESLGYSGLYKKRTGIRCDGCAIYYKKDKFNLVEYETVEFYQPNVTILNRDNVAIIAKFSPINAPESAFIVATTHLLYNPKRQDVRLAQTQLFLAEIERLSYYTKHKSGDGGRYWPIIITGDFNSTPDSAVYEFITKGTLRYDHLSARRLDASQTETQGPILVPSNLQITDKSQHARLVQKREKQEQLSRIEEAALIRLHNSDRTLVESSSEILENRGLFSSGTISHLFAFKSVYNHGDPDNSEGTTFQGQWLSVDYIFYSGKQRIESDIKEGKLKLISRYRLPRTSELGSIKIPNSSLGSDHLSLVAKFKLRV